ncbi:Aldo/keto reductase [Lentinus tigrinus ALCF2SS1-7]|uniref:Aldo/keto reductase n=1 Tax=Lentinus tigrinus ALCF2SS1-6 TaxID=1328759 RepID=A0A5C2S3K7_9APHY|nr:Aldo/keto reductase [Lentinus tigrinus ALCF2SS1-6]RPD72230.1 Aldo/keto reductase [Lentinus tigrinus ALCF2SS1-7]
MATIFTPAPPPPTPLGRYRQLSPLAGIHVSPICLGGMSLGDKWAPYGMGAMDKQSSFGMLDAYQDGSSEEFIGEWMEKRGVRDQMVVATKYSANMKRGATDVAQKVTVQYVGNNVKSMTISLDASLKKLRTHYVDIFYVHFWDWETSVEEIMNGLHNLVASGKVLYLGISDSPSWVVSKANLYARMTGKTPFSIYQGDWSVLRRDLEREIVPMARAEGLALAPFDVLAGGKIRTDEEEERRRQTGEKGRTVMGDWERTENERKISKALEEVAKQVGAKSIQAVAIAYVMQKTPYVFPVIGGRKPEHLRANLEALNITLTSEHFRQLDSVLPFPPMFPYMMIGDGSEPSHSIRNAAVIDVWPRAQAIRPQ